MNNHFYFTWLLVASLQTSMLLAMNAKLTVRQAQVEQILHEADQFITTHEQFRHHGANQQIFEQVQHYTTTFVDNFLNGVFEEASPTQQFHIARNIVAGGELKNDIARQLGIPLDEY